MKNMKLRNGLAFIRDESGDWCSIYSDCGIKTIFNDMSNYLLENLDSFDNIFVASEKLIEKYFLDIRISKQIIKEISEFVFKMIREGTIIYERKIIFQSYYSYEVTEGMALYFPYLRKLFKVTNELYKLILASTVKTFDDIETISSASTNLDELISILNVSVAVDEVEKHHLWNPTRIVLLPTTLCNLRCQYCYAWKENKKSSMMTKEIARAGINYVFQNAIKNNTPSVDISFMGGGEPTCNWPVLVDAVEYARMLAKENSVPSSTMLTTNGILSNEQIDWLVDNIDFIKISFDGIREVQNVQRPTTKGDSFELVSNTMLRLSEKRAKFLVRLTVTNESVKHLHKSVKYIIDSFLPTSIIINPVYVCGSCASHGVGSIAYNSMCDAFKDIEDLGLEKGIDIVTPYDKITYMDIPRMPFCGFQKGNIFLTPDGYISACSEIDSNNDNRSNIFFFGNWDTSTNKLIINEEKLEQLHKISNSKNDKCNTCNNSIMCSGPCLTRRLNDTIISKITFIREGKTVNDSFGEDEMSLLIHGNHSDESTIQCKMTNILSGIQIERILAMGEKLNTISLSVTSCKLSREMSDIGVQKMIEIHADNDSK